ncbi:transposase, partial [Neisseria gonorrhoeae]
LPSAGASVITPATSFVIPCLSSICESSKTGKKKALLLVESKGR